jgi:hypothetical protein
VEGARGRLELAGRGGCIDGGTYIGFTFLSPFMPAWMPQWDLSRVADIDSNDE